MATEMRDATSALLELAALPLDERPDGLGAARFVGADLSGAVLIGADLRGLDLTDADLSGARLNNADLRGTILHGARLERASLLGADLREADLSGVSAASATFGAANAEPADLSQADLTSVSWTGANLDHADLRGATLRDARLRGASLVEATFLRADLRGADLSDADVRHASFREADLSAAHLKLMHHSASADWIGVTLIDVDFTGAYLTRRVMMDQNYLYEFRAQGRRHELIYQLWWFTSDCGRSFGRWATLTLVIVLMFSGLYRFVEVDYGDYETALSPLYYSLVTMTTLGYGDVLPASASAQVVASIQVVIGYFLVGGLLGIFANKMSRRAD